MWLTHRYMHPTRAQKRNDKARIQADDVKEITLILRIVRPQYAEKRVAAVLQCLRQAAALETAKN